MESTGHTGYGKPHFRWFQLQQRLQFRQSKFLFIHQVFGATADDGVEVRLNLEKHLAWNVVLEFGSQNPDQVAMPSPFRHVHCPLSAGIPERPPRAQIDQALDHRNFRAVPGSLMQRGVPGRSTGPGGIDPTPGPGWVPPFPGFGKKIEHAGPFGIPGCIC